MAISGWCGTHGKPDCGRCKWAPCEHECHENPQVSGGVDMPDRTVVRETMGAQVNEPPPRNEAVCA